MEKEKYKFTNETITVQDELGNDHILHRIKALRDFHCCFYFNNFGEKRHNWSVHKGELGGFIEFERNLSQDGGCWISESSKVFGNAVVREDAYVGFDSTISGGIRYNVVQRDKNSFYDCSGPYIGGVLTEICGCASVTGKAEVGGGAKISGQASVVGAKIKGPVIIEGEAKVALLDRVEKGTEKTELLVLENSVFCGKAELEGSGVLRSVVVPGKVSLMPGYYAHTTLWGDQGPRDAIKNTLIGFERGEISADQVKEIEKDLAEIEKKHIRFAYPDKSDPELVEEEVQGFVNMLRDEKEAHDLRVQYAAAEKERKEQFDKEHHASWDEKRVKRAERRQAAFDTIDKAVEATLGGDK